MEFLQSLNQNMYLSAFSMLMLNLGSRYIVMDISKAQETLLKSAVVRRLTVFCIFYMATRDILWSLGFTLLFVLVTACFFHEESKYCLLPSAFRKNLTVTPDEVAIAKKTLELYEQQQPSKKLKKDKKKVAIQPKERAS